ncbi:hypothetical protein MTAT_20060 [Moorella thermoacetica]|uniref:Uncharacterized protein n=1 Tax=Neomoorella thermoacetica TaxID=1525 RepID=A0AAC9MVH6_NEOTH|nr:hypothetical protein [Moorella thermoacetica]AOQ24661.1 hypothetical protein Maut_02233 [Moorella thermoacetica]TYL12764.1 hypothetical protein MTAT_20060 [Moorella thermoacetica]
MNCPRCTHGMYQKSRLNLGGTSFILLACPCSCGFEFWVKEADEGEVLAVS